jgi:hypothetical protein
MAKLAEEKTATSAGGIAERLRRSSDAGVSVSDHSESLTGGRGSPAPAQVPSRSASRQPSPEASAAAAKAAAPAPAAGGKPGAGAAATSPLRTLARPASLLDPTARSSSPNKPPHAAAATKK